VVEHSSRIAPILFVCRASPSFVSSTHALQIIARCDRPEATGETNMFMHRKCGRQAQAVSLGILTAALVTATAAAAETAHPFVLVAYSNTAGGANLVSGDYGSAAQAVHQHSDASLPDPQALDTNRCVAYAMNKQLPQARAACDAAVRDAHSADDSMLLAWNAQARRESAASAAVAYSNRAVLHWLDADLSAAQEDLAKAQALAPQASFVVRNLTAIRARQNTSAQSSATAQVTGAQE
jgi:hypothetical protein